MTTPDPHQSETKRDCPACATAGQTGRFCSQCGFPLGTVSADDPLLGTELPGGYLILERLSEGSLGPLYRAEQRLLGRSVAVKMLHPWLRDDDHATTRFVTEAKAASTLNHPNSVAVIDFGEHDGHLYLIMELLRGVSLETALADEPLMPVGSVVHIVCQVLAALTEAHHLGIIHRDLRPSNIVLETRRDGSYMAKVVDFGLAKIKATNKTIPGQTFSPLYVTPEQTTGKPVDARTDLYTCGLLLYEMLVGQHPFKGMTPDKLIAAHLSQAPPDPIAAAPDGRVSELLSQVILRALAKAPSDRWPSAEAMAKVLQHAVMPDVSDPNAASAPTRLCHRCRAPVLLTKKFCGSCGAPVADRPGRKGRSASSPSPARRTPSAPAFTEFPLGLIERDDELAWAALLRDNARTGVSVGHLIGPAGVGKSRLLEEFGQEVREADVTAVYGGTDPWCAGVIGFPIRTMVEALLAAGAGGTPSVSAAIQGASKEASRGMALLFGRPLPDDSAVDVKVVAKAMAAALMFAIDKAHGLSSSGVVLLADDIHLWDGASEHTLQELIEGHNPANVTVLATHTSDYTPKWRAELRELAGVPRRVAARLAPDLGLDGSDDVAPLWLDQRLRMEGNARSAPHRLGDLVSFRIKQLPADARSLLFAAAVQGDAPLSVLEEMVPEVDNLPQALAALKDAGLVHSDDNARIVVTHPVFRDVVLAATPAGVRTAAFRVAAAARAAHGVPVPLEVQAHWACLAEDSFSALMLIEQVAARAAALKQWDDSVSWLRRGVELARRELVRGELDDPMHALRVFSRKLGEALLEAGNTTDAEGALKEARDIEGASSAERVYVLAALARVAKARGRTTDAKALLDQADGLARDADDAELIETIDRLRRNA